MSRFDKMNKVKSEQLGMSHSTANAQLRKAIMFDLVKKCGMDNCFQCGEKIEDIDNFSIEHKVPWLHSENPSELFFSLDNIAFSHHKCNVANARQPETKDRKIPNGKIRLKGVHYYKRLKKPYRACVFYEGRTMWLGCFETAEEAGRVYDRKAIELYGKDAVTNESLGLL